MWPFDTVHCFTDLAFHTSWPFMLSFPKHLQRHKSYSFPARQFLILHMMPNKSDDIHDDDSDLLKPYVETELVNADLFGEWLQQELGDGKDHQGIISKVAAALGVFKNTLQSLSLESTLPNPRLWNMQVDAVNGNDLKVIFSIPGSEEKIEVVAKDQDELQFLKGDKCLGYMSKVWHGLAQSLDRLTIYAQKCKELKAQEAELMHPAEATVRKHINLLKEYNDMKDIGQQVIGLIAENKGVQIGKLYEHGDYGVTADD
ncbi:uncharacterized protein QC763_204845 [Podospora pseudopauciseta]|uniref:Swi5-domain-containing protein n=1 Tax=Podospora pseudopauciseta TaxID=2093780 RepID=A0ABR0HNZ8_9PEZI|nr:hypothetical protein QC763_204845 [Podospora pseudopauciseta]